MAAGDSMLNYTNAEVRVVGSCGDQVARGRLREITTPIVRVEFTPGAGWKVGQELSCVIDDPEEPMRVDAVVLANDATGTSLWVTFSTIEPQAPQIVLDPGPVYVTLNT